MKKPAEPAESPDKSFRAVSISNDPPDLPVHYLHTGPSPIFGIVALTLTLALLALGIAEIRNTTSETSLTISSTGAAIEGVPILKITSTTWAINNQPITESDLPFRLSALSAHSQAIVIEHDQALTAERLTQALETVNQAGFAQVGVRTILTSSDSANGQP